MQQQATFDFPTPPLASVEKMMPHDARIREVYLTGKGIRATAKELGLGKSLVEHAVARMGIGRSEAQARNTGIDWDKAVVLYKAGHGTKHIAKACGTTNHPSIREGLIRRGVYQLGRATARANETWAGYVEAEIHLHARREKEHNAWWSGQWTRAKSSAQIQLDNYLRGKQRAIERYHRVKHHPASKMAQMARSQVRRISQVSYRYISTSTAPKYLGCTYKEAADYIKSLLPDGWSWANYGTEWEIDHIIQLSDGDLLDEQHVRKVCHYTNLRPLSVIENRTRPRGNYDWAYYFNGRAS